MAGFINYNTTDNNSSNGLKTFSNSLRKILKMGRDYEDLIKRQKIGFGVNELAALKAGVSDQDDIAIASSFDINPNSNKTVGFYQQDFTARRNFLRRMAAHREISNFIDIIADEAIVYDDNNFFCQPITNTLDDLEGSQEEQIKTALQDNFEYIYTKVLKYKDNKAAWKDFQQYLVDGSIAYQIVYDDDKKRQRIISALKLDVATLVPHVRMVNGEEVSGWLQNPGDSAFERFLPDTHVIYIASGKTEFAGEMSYVQSLVRSFNLYRTMENTAVIWTIMNSSFRLKTIIPVAGNQAKIQQTVGEVISRFREEVEVDSESGEIKIDGQPQLNLFRNYALASKNGQQVQVDAIKYEGYDFSNSDAMKYWRDKLWEDSRIPFARLQKDSSSTFMSSTEGYARDEIRFGKFIKRLHSDFQEIITKMLYLQMCLDFPKLDGDFFKSKIGISFNQENQFEEKRRREKMKADLEDIQNIYAFKGDDDKPYWDLDLLIEEFGEFSYDLLRKNKEIKEKKAKEADGETKETDMAEGSELDLDLGGDTGGELDLDLGNETEETPEPLGGETGGETPTGGGEELDLDLNLNI